MRATSASGEKADAFAAALAVTEERRGALPRPPGGPGLQPQPRPLSPPGRGPPLAGPASASWRRSGRRSGSLAAEAALLGTAGFLAAEMSADSGRVRRALEDTVARTIEPLSARVPVRFLPWELTGRPQNHPARRLAGAARLLVRYVDGGLLAGLLAAVSAGPAALAGALQVPADGFWRDHYDLTGGPARLPAGLIGPGRAGELAVNIVLPFALAWAESRGDAPLAEAAVAASTAAIPAPPPTALLRSLSAALGSRVTAGARRQQGMLHLFRRYCRQGGCAGDVAGQGRCPLA